MAGFGAARSRVFSAYRVEDFDTAPPNFGATTALPVKGSVPESCSQGVSGGTEAVRRHRTGLPGQPGTDRGNAGSAARIMTTIALPISENKRIAPLFDAARQVFVVQYQGRREIGRREVSIGNGALLERLHVLSSNSVDVLLCEAISAPFEMLVAAAGIEVIHHVCGPVEAVLNAYVNGRLSEDAFAMPGGASGGPGGVGEQKSHVWFI